MSRSRRKTPIIAVTTCRSERDDKKLWHQRWRSRERAVLKGAAPETLNAHLTSLKNDVSDIWSMGKDGHRYWSPKDQMAMAERVADRTGRTAQERASLKRRLLRKYMSK